MSNTEIAGTIVSVLGLIMLFALVALNRNVVYRPVIRSDHDDNHFVYDPSYMGIEQFDGLIFIQATLNKGRKTTQIKFLHKTIAEWLSNDLSVRLQDIFISLVEVKKENWSFGNDSAHPNQIGYRYSLQ